jgi:hypothetical protein
MPGPFLRDGVPFNVKYEQLLVQTRALVEPSSAASIFDPSAGCLSAAAGWLAGLANLTAAATWMPTITRALPGHSSLRRIC